MKILTKTQSKEKLYKYQIADIIGYGVIRGTKVIVIFDDKYVKYSCDLTPEQQREYFTENGYAPTFLKNIMDHYEETGTINKDKELLPQHKKEVERFFRSKTW